MPGPANTDNDTFTLVILGCLGLSAVIGSAGWLWGRGLDWLLAHQVLVPAGQHPLLPLPYAAGAGLDAERAAVAAAVVLVVLAVLVSAARRAVLRRRQVTAA